MLTLRPTKLLARRLRLDLPAAPPPVHDHLADWCVHEFRVGGHRFLMLCHTASLFPLVTLARSMNHEAALIKHCLRAMQFGFVGTELEFAYQRWIVPAARAVQYAPIPDKAVLSSLNELILHARGGMDKSPIDLSRWLAQTPMKVLGHDSPDRVFSRLASGPRLSPR
jgi:hypothetical protein